LLVVIREAFVNKAFVPEEPLPEVEGRAELIVHTQMPDNAASQRPSICDLFGKAKRLRSAEDVDSPLGKERVAWEKA
jgi:hypothetical protein